MPDRSDGTVMSPDPTDPWPSGDQSDDAAAPERVYVPDDARELARDVAAWKREVRWQRRRERLDRWAGAGWLTRRTPGPTNAWPSSQPYRLVPGKVVIAIMLAITLMGVALVVFIPHAVRQSLAPARLALAAPTTAAGRVGGLVPDADLTTTRGAIVHARDLRPAVLALVPADCGCTVALKALIADAAAADLLPVDLISTASQWMQLANLADQVGGKRVVQFRDMQSELIDGIRPRGLTIVPVHTDGVIASIVRNFQVPDAPEQDSIAHTLTQLGQPGFDDSAAGPISIRLKPAISSP